MVAQERFAVRSADDVGRAIAEIRRRRSLTQAELADLSGMSRESLAQFEIGRSGGALDRMLRLLRRLGATVTITMDDDGQA